MDWCKKFYFAGSPDVAWEGLTTALAPMGGEVTSDDFRTLVLKRQSRVVVVEFEIAMLPDATDAMSVLEAKRQHHVRSPFTDGRSLGWQGLDQLSDELIDVILGVGYMRWPPPPPMTSFLRTVTFRRALKGYDVHQVDEFLEALAAKLQRGEEVFSEDVTSDEFRLSWKGYHTEEVDEFLERLAATLTR
jgi:DivIVA domain-containing protein